MTKELLIEILKTNGNLYTVIDSFIELNDNRYGTNILEICKQSYTAELHTDKVLAMVDLLKISLLTINTIYYIINVDYAYFCQSAPMIPLLSVNGAFEEIVLLVCPTTNIHDLYIENIASFIYAKCY